MRQTLIVALALSLIACIAYLRLRRRRPGDSRMRYAQGPSALRRRLLQKAMGDEAQVNRLIDFERRRRPDASMENLMQAAIERWERDSR